MEASIIMLFFCLALIKLSSCVCLGQASQLSVSIVYMVRFVLKFNGIQFVNLYVFVVTYRITINMGESYKIPKSCTVEIQILKFAVYPQNMNNSRLNG